MKIIQIYDTDQGEFPITGNGSPATITHQIAMELVDRGHDVTVLSGGDSEPRKQNVNGARYVSFGTKKRSVAPYNEITDLPIGPVRLFADTAEFAWQALHYIQENDVDVIHAHFPFTPLLLVYLDRSLRNRMVYTAHIGDEDKRLGLNNEAPLPTRLFSPDIHLMKKVEKTILLNEEIERKINDLGINRGRTSVIPNGIAVSDFDPDRNSRDIAEKYHISGTTVLFAGNIIQRKGIHDLITAADRVHGKSDKEICYLMVGDDELNSEYADEMKKRATQACADIRFTGHIPYDDLKRLYELADVFVLPSYQEGSPMVLLEALAAGTALIGTNVGGVQMIIEDEQNGFVVKRGDVVALSRKIQWLVENTDERNEMKKRSRQKAISTFNWSRIGEQYVEVYEEVKDG